MSQCSHRPPCPGCPRFGEPGIAASALGTLNRLAADHGLPPVTVTAGPMAGFRHRARLAIRGRLGSPKVGLFEMGSHRVVHIPGCQVHHPLINRVAAIVRRALVEARVSCYSERAHLGLARYLQVVVERSSQSAQVVLVANAPAIDPWLAGIDLIRQRLGGDLHSLWVNPNLERSNTILGPQFLPVCGPRSVVERFGADAVHYPPGAFGQNNLEVASAIIDYLREQIPAGAQVAEYYAGVGAIGLSVLSRVQTLRLNEVGSQSLLGLELGIGALTPIERDKISVVSGSAASAAALAMSDGMEVVIVDPPRKGLDLALRQHLMERPPQRLIYVSCGLDSLCTDVTQLESGDTLRLSSLAAFDLLPFTNHVETVACFERKR